MGVQMIVATDQEPIHRTDDSAQNDESESDGGESIRPDTRILVVGEKAQYEEDAPTDEQQRVGHDEHPQFERPSHDWGHSKRTASRRGRP